MSVNSAVQTHTYLLFCFVFFMQHFQKAIQLHYTYIIRTVRLVKNNMVKFKNKNNTIKHAEILNNEILKKL